MQKIKHQEITWNILSRYRSQIMGVAIIWIMLFHGGEFYPEMMKDIPLLGYIVDRGMMGVEMFLFVSGMGLYFSFTKDDHIKSFYLKRINRVLIPYLVISLPFWIWRNVWIRGDIKALFMDISQLSFWIDGDRSMWYIALTLLLYAVYPLLFKVFLKDDSSVKKGIFMGVSLLLPIVFFMVSPSWFSKIEIAIWRISSFVLGCVLAKWIMEGRKISKYHLIVLLAVSASLIKITFMINEMMKFPGIVRLIYLPLSLIACLLISVFLDFVKINWLNRFLGTAGRYSLELYMLHIFLKVVCLEYLPDGLHLSTSQGMIVWLGIIIVCFILSIVIHKGLEKVDLRTYIKKEKIYD